MCYAVVFPYTGKSGIKTVIAAKEYYDSILVKEIQQQKRLRARKHGSGQCSGLPNNETFI
jgi:hypothetical protein